jgi:hypothetical protein
MTDPFVRQLGDVCRQWPTRAKRVIVPSHALGHTLGDRLARGEINWTNLRIVTPLDLALRMAGQFRRARHHAVGRHARTGAWSRATTHKAVGALYSVRTGQLVDVL